MFLVHRFIYACSTVHDTKEEAQKKLNELWELERFDWRSISSMEEINIKSIEDIDGLELCEEKDN